MVKILLRIYAGFVMILNIIQSEKYRNKLKKEI